MATGILIEYNGMTAKEYDRVMENLRLDQNPPRGRLFHAAGPTRNGWLVFNIYETRQDYEEFYNNRVLNALKQAGLSNPTRIEYLPIHNAIVPQPAALTELVATISSR